MNDDLFSAILAMDSYNKGGSDFGANLEVNGNIGNASLVTVQAGATAGWLAAGFYAVAYDTSHVAGYGANTVISYRGTNTTAPTEFANDFLNG